MSLFDVKTQGLAALFVLTCGLVPASASLPPSDPKMTAQQDSEASSSVADAWATLDSELGEFKALTQKGAELTKQLEQDPSNPATLTAFQRNEEQKGALVKQGDELAQKFPASEKVQNGAAALALQAGDYKKGLAYADRAVGLAERGSDAKALQAALRTRAAGELWSGDYPAAAADAERILKASPGDVHARTLYEAAKGRVKGAPPAAGGAARPLDDFLVQVSALDDPRVKRAGQRAADRKAAEGFLVEASRLLGLNDGQGGLRAARQAQALDPSVADAYMDQAMAWRILKDLTQALTEVTKAIGLWTAQGNTRNLPAAYTLRAQLENEQKNHEAAAADADKALSFGTPRAAAFLERARAKEGLGAKGEEILADYSRAAQLDAGFQASYDDAVRRFSGAGQAAAAGGAAPDGSGRFNAALAAAFALLAALAAFALWLSRRVLRSAGAGSARDGDERRALDAQYDVVEQIGEGGMGAVYKGWDKSLKRPVAIKRLRAELQKNPRERDRFIKEAEMVASLRHPHIVEIYTIIRDSEDTHLVFEYLVGGTVHQLLNESSGRHFTAKRALEILKAIAQAVDHAHARHVIHRDLKPANVMITDAGWVKVMDFGIARQVADSMLTTTNTIVGTPTYMAPEQAMGAVVRESDVYALGVTLYEMLTGALPFKGADEMREKLDGRYVAPSYLVPDLPPAVDAVIAKALAPRSEERYHSCMELYRAAAEALEGRVTPLPA